MQKIGTSITMASIGLRRAAGIPPMVGFDAVEQPVAWVPTHLNHRTAKGGLASPARTATPHAGPRVLADPTLLILDEPTGIEHDDYSGCGGDFYTRGHIRAIAKAVGIDPVPLIGEYDAAHPEDR